MNKKYQKFIDRIQASSSIALFAHQRPDGDAVGSVLGMQHLIMDNFVDKKVSTFILDEVPEVFSFLPGSQSIATNLDDSGVDFSSDLIIMLDIGAFYRTGIPDNILRDISPDNIINIDHHPSGDENAYLHIIDTGRSSVAEMLAVIADEQDWTVSSDAAQALLTGMYTDTGSFQHGNTTAATLQIAGKLADLVPNISQITRSIYKSETLEFLQDVGLHLSQMQKVGDAAIIVIDPTRDHDIGLKNALVSMLNTIEDILYALVLMQDDGDIRGSFRSRSDDQDVSIYAGQLGGGGHKQAAAFCIPGRINKSEEGYMIEREGSKISLAEFIATLD